MAGTSVFGWCIDSLHRKCIVEISGLKCSCNCHGMVDTDKLEPELAQDVENEE